AGACQVLGCDQGFGDCDGSAKNGCESNLTNDAKNCGTCARVCPSGPNSTASCGGGTCSLACTNGFANCDPLPANGCETSVDFDPRNCGACARTCVTANGTAVCDVGQCAIGSCNAGFADCDKD